MPGALQVEAFRSEDDLLRRLAALVHGLDPDVLVGWDVQRGSLGYLADRASTLGLNLLRQMSRCAAWPSPGGVVVCRAA